MLHKLLRVSPVIKIKCSRSQAAESNFSRIKTETLLNFWSRLKCRREQFNSSQNLN